MSTRSRRCLLGVAVLKVVDDVLDGFQLRQRRRVRLSRRKRMKLVEKSRKLVKRSRKTTYADGEIHEIVILPQCLDHSGELAVAEEPPNDLLVALILHHHEADEDAGDAGEDRVLHVTPRVLHHWKRVGVSGNLKDLLVHLRALTASS
jgi:hypothetical protein